MKFTNCRTSESRIETLSINESLQPLSIYPESNLKRSIAVFDIGGTWFRSGLFREPTKLFEVERKPAINFKNTQSAVGIDLQKKLGDYLLEEVSRLLGNTNVKRIAVISMGAALNANTGEIYQSGPLWGPYSTGFILEEYLKAKRPDIEWIIINDVTATLCRYIADRPGQSSGKTSLFTISSGIACRTYDADSDRIPVDDLYGLQGEIGHTTIDFVFRNRPHHLQCDCGGLDHINAFCSGRGIEALICHLSVCFPKDFTASILYEFCRGNNENLTFNHFRKAVGRSDKWTSTILNAVTKPIARHIVNLLTLDPDVNRIIMTGGVVHSIEREYMGSLFRNLDTMGMYQISNRDASFFSKRIEVGQPDDNSGLLGAGIYALKYGFRHFTTARNIRLDCTVKSQLHVMYDVKVTNSILRLDNPKLTQEILALSADLSRCFIIVDDGVHKYHGKAIRAYFGSHNLIHEYLVLPTSEQTKTMDAVIRILEILNDFSPKRRSEPIIAFGGGVLLDIVGFGASIYRRGIQYVRVPTTLLGMVDAGIGAKTGVSFGDGKNRIGTFYPPALVLLDKGFIRTLDNRHIINGIAEIVKIAITKDAELFQLLETHADVLIKEKFQNSEIADTIIRRSVHLMLDELEPNLWEANLSRSVDFGHTFSPRLEQTSLPSLLHGEAVSIDIAISAFIAYHRQLLRIEERDKIIFLLQRIGLPITHSLCDTTLLVEALNESSLNRDGRQRVPLPIRIGATEFYDDIKAEEIDKALEILGSIHEDS